LRRVNTSSEADRQRFEADGYLVLEGFVDDAACDALRARALELVAAFEPGALRSVFTTDESARKIDDYFLDSGDDVRFFFEEGAFDASGAPTRAKELSINKIGHALHDLDPVFDRFSRAPKLASLVAHLGMRDPLLVQSMYIFKQPHIGGEVKCHQDATFLHTEPQSLLGLWFALEDATKENGCLWALPGGHRRGLGQRFVRDADRRTRFEAVVDGGDGVDGGGGGGGAADVSRDALVPLEVKKGTLIVLDGLVPHMSEANQSATSRHAYTLHVIPKASAYPDTNWLRRRSEMPMRGFSRPSAPHD
jgi:phytanoyl-CoA hydroxylase